MTNALDLTAPVDTLAMEFTREFDASVAALFRAHADADLFRRWIGPRAGVMTIDRWDFQTGGGYRYVHDDAGEYAFHGVFHTVRDGELIIQTFEFEGAPDSVNLEYLWFDDLGDRRSRLRGRSICPTLAARDGLLNSGMEGGMSEGYDKLDELLARI